MTPKTSKTRRKSTERRQSPIWYLIVVIGLLWVVCGAMLAGRRHFVMQYLAFSLGPPHLEPFFASNLSIGLLLLVGSLWSLLTTRILGAQPALLDSAGIRGVPAKLIAAQAMSLLPIGLSFLRSLGLPIPIGFWEILWFAALSGISWALLSKAWTDWFVEESKGRNHREKQETQQAASQTEFSDSRIDGLLRALLHPIVLAVACLGCAVWWYAQTVWYYDHFLLGFNDFGHFAQRVANTSEGRGLLLETPVLPPFWDHFNPGLLAFVPLWKLYPSVHLFFWTQALCLALGGIVIWRIAITAGHSKTASVLWGGAWLVQPCLGQMNIAYTYGWHPVSLAIPMLLSALLLLQLGKFQFAIAVALLASLVEEGVVVVIACFCLACWLQIYLGKTDREAAKVQGRPKSIVDAVPRWGWLLGFLISSIAFVAIYQFSGIADFQTGRFVALGENVLEILASPLLRPAAFWGELLSATSIFFVFSLALPCFAPGLIAGWRLLIGAAVPLGVLMVWDHVPATCLAFQYPSAVLPVIWMAAIQGSFTLNSKGIFAPASGALVTGLILSIFIGQFPFSSPSIEDALSISYPLNGLDMRGPNAELGRWLNAQIATVREQGGPVLASSRIAAHLVGNEDVETLGQYLRRRPELNQLPDRRGQPLLHYQWLIVDKEESMQQSTDEVEAVLQEANQYGFQRVEAFGPILVLRPRSDHHKPAKSLSD